MLASDQSLATVSDGALATMCAGNIYYRSNQNKPQITSSYKYVIKFMLSPKMIIIIICVYVVSVLVNQYASVVYPLFADSAALDKGQIGNITMFAVVICFLINAIFKKKIALTNQRTLLIVVFFFNVYCVFVLYTKRYNTLGKLYFDFCHFRIQNVFGSIKDIMCTLSPRSEAGPELNLYFYSNLE